MRTIEHQPGAKFGASRLFSNLFAGLANATVVGAAASLRSLAAHDLTPITRRHAGLEGVGSGHEILNGLPAPQEDGGR